MMAAAASFFGRENPCCKRWWWWCSLDGGGGGGGGGPGEVGKAGRFKKGLLLGCCGGVGEWWRNRASWSGKMGAREGFGCVGET